jgi:hypothetical protein
MKKINRDARILSISHNDLDGTTCQIVLGNVFPNIDYQSCSYKAADITLQNTDFSKYDHIIITDVSPEDKTLLENDKIIFIDHHETAVGSHSPKDFRFVSEGQAACVLTKNIFELYYRIKLDNLNDLVYLSNDYDLWIHKNYKSKFINELHSVYKYIKFRSRFFNGDTRFTFDEILILRYRMVEYQEHFSKIKLVDFGLLKGCMVMNDEGGKFVNDVCADLLKKYRIVFAGYRNGHMSVRHNFEGLHIGNFLAENNLGGGHEFTAGIFCDIHSDSFVDMMEMIECKLVQQHPQLAR